MRAFILPAPAHAGDQAAYPSHIRKYDRRIERVRRTLLQADRGSGPVMTRPVRRTRRTLQVAGAGVAALLALSACSSSDSGSGAPGSDSSASASAKPSGEVTVFAAASLKESFTTLGRQFEKDHPGAKV